MVDRGIGSMTNRVFSIVRKLFNWAVEEDIVAVSPCARMRAPVPENSRDRVLTDEELSLFWKAASSLDYPFGPLTRLLLLTGQRLSEVAEMTWAEIDTTKRLWTIPRERAKNDVAHEVPLSDAAMALIDALPRIGSHEALRLHHQPAPRRRAASAAPRSSSTPSCSPSPAARIPIRSQFRIGPSTIFAARPPPAWRASASTCR